MIHDEVKRRKQEYDRVRYARIRSERIANKPPDHILSLSEPEKAYIAGIVDGEGSIFAAAVGPERTRTVYPIVIVAMTHVGVIEWLQEHLQTGTIKLHNQSNLRRHPHYLPQYRVELFGKRAKTLCQVLLPYLIVKRQQAELVASFPTEARVAPGATLANTSINDERYRLRDMINALNHPAAQQPRP